MYIWLFSRSLGAASAMTRNTRGLTRSVIALMVPPLPAPSRPSNTMQIFSPLCLTHSCSLTSSTCRRFSSVSYSLRENVSEVSTVLRLIRCLDLVGTDDGMDFTCGKGGQGLANLLNESLVLA